MREIIVSMNVKIHLGFMSLLILGNGNFSLFLGMVLLLSALRFLYTKLFNLQIAKASHQPLSLHLLFCQLCFSHLSFPE